MAIRFRAYALTGACALALIPAAALAQNHDHAHHASPAAVAPAQAQTPAVQAQPAPSAHAAHEGHVMTPDAMADMPGMDHSAHTGHQAHGMSMVSTLGPWPMTRDASGTSWQPDLSEHGGIHATYGDWSIMSHAMFNLVYDQQNGPRGGAKTFVAGMVMGAARRDFADGSSLSLRAMLSPDALMGKSGYPLLLAAGETADGVHPLVDRQHPHDLLMELSASYSRKLSERDSVYVYVGLPGEPAFGPPAFMHRMSAMDSPEAPITHHWLDSTHIVFGVATVGWAHDAFKIEASSFKGQEPDQHRYDIDSPKLDSWSVRASWNPSPAWALQASYAKVKGPEQLEPDEDDTKLSASAIHTRKVGADGWWSSTLAWGRKTNDHDVSKDAWLLESAIHPDDRWTVFARAERIETDELIPGVGGGHGDIHTVSKASVGAIHDWKLSSNTRFGLGGLYAFNRVPTALEPAYGRNPDGAMVFVRLKIG